MFVVCRSGFIPEVKLPKLSRVRLYRNSISPVMEPCQTSIWNKALDHQEKSISQLMGLLLPFLLLLLLSYAVQSCEVTSLVEGMAVPLMHFPLWVRAGIWKLAMVPAMGCLLCMEDTVRSLTSNI